MSIFITHTIVNFFPQQELAKELVSSGQREAGASWFETAADLSDNIEPTSVRAFEQSRIALVTASSGLTEEARLTLQGLSEMRSFWNDDVRKHVALTLLACNEPDAAADVTTEIADKEITVDMSIEFVYYWLKKLGRQLPAVGAARTVSGAVESWMPGEVASREIGKHLRALRVLPHSVFTRPGRRSVLQAIYSEVGDNLPLDDAIQYLALLPSIDLAWWAGKRICARFNCSPDVVERVLSGIPPAGRIRVVRGITDDLDATAHVPANIGLHLAAAALTDRSLVSFWVLHKTLEHCGDVELLKQVKQEVDEIEGICGAEAEKDTILTPQEATRVPEKQDEKRREITFTDTSVIVEGQDKPFGKTSPLRIAEYLILKGGNRVHYLWAYVILPTFNPIRRGPEWQFTNYISKAKGVLARWGIDIGIATCKGEGGDSFGLCEPTGDRVVSNASDVVKLYRDAWCHHKDGKTSEAIGILSGVSKDAGNNWYVFADAWMDLADWIRDQNFAGAGDDLILRCREFLTRYLRRLRIGISRIELYMKYMEVGRKRPLSEESTEAFAAIKAECKKAETLHDAFLRLKALAPEEHTYEQLVRDLQNLHDHLHWIQESEEKADYGHVVDEAVRRLCRRNKTLAEIVQDGLVGIDQMLDRLDQHGTRSDREIDNIREEVPFILGDIVAGTESFDEFDQNKGDRLGYLKHWLCCRLRQRLAKLLSGRQP